MYFNRRRPDEYCTKFNPNASVYGAQKSEIISGDRHFLDLDLVAENNQVDKLARRLKSNTEVIREAQRIHFNMFKTLIGGYKYAMMFGLHRGGNKGDPAISVGQLLLLRRLKIEIIFTCFVGCASSLLDQAQALSTQYSNKELVILLQGGGNLLSYHRPDDFREKVLGRFHDFEAILFPESVWPRYNVSTQKHFQAVYSKHPHLTFLYRDRDSYDKGKVLFPKTRALLAPDIAFQIGAVSRFMPPTHDILWLHRQDVESARITLPDKVKDFDVCISDWVGWKTPEGSTKEEDPFLIAANGLLFLQRGRVVITDRLHGHILSTLVGIPHVVLDPVNHKITSFMKSWTGGLENVIVANSSEDALNKALDLLNKTFISEKSQGIEP